MTYGPYLGLYALGYLTIGYAAGFATRLFYKEDITYPIIIITLADVMYGFYMYVVCFLIRGRLDLLFYIRRIILPEAAYTAIIAIFLYRLNLVLLTKLDSKGSENLIV